MPLKLKREITKLSWARAHGLDDVVASIHFRVSCVCTETLTRHVIHETYGDLAAPDPAHFVSLDELTEEAVMSWIPEGYWAEMERVARERVESKKTSGQGSGVPWGAKRKDASRQEHRAEMEKVARERAAA